MDDFGGLIWIAIIWFFASFLSGQKKRKQRADQARRQARTRAQPAPPKPKPASSSAHRPAVTVAADPTQREGSALERMLRQLGADLEGLEQRQRGPTGRRSDARLPSAEDVEDRESLERPVTIVERTPVVRPERVVVDLDDQAEEIVRRRVVAAEERNRPMTLADHRAFDEKIRESSPQTKTAPRVRRASIDLRRAVVWREVLGPPLALRDPTDK